MEKKNVVIHDKITIGISACCMGSPVRYNNKGWDMLATLGREKQDFMWCPVCPETMSGLGVPRGPHTPFWRRRTHGAQWRSQSQKP